jgi:uncharacterized protein YjbI with pentapeptide repeats
MFVGNTELSNLSSWYFQKWLFSNSAIQQCLFSNSAIQQCLFSNSAIQQCLFSNSHCWIAETTSESDEMSFSHSWFCHWRVW